MLRSSCSCTHFSFLAPKKVCFGTQNIGQIYIGYYTVARRYEFYVLVANTISHEWAALTREILCLPRQHKIHIFEPTCNVPFIRWRQNIWNCPFLFSSRRKCREILWKPSNRTRSSFLCFRCRSFRKTLSLVHRLVKQTCLRSSSRKVSHEWLATLRENNRTNNMNNTPSPKHNSSCYTRGPLELQAYESCYTTVLR